MQRLIAVTALEQKQLIIRVSEMLAEYLIWKLYFQHIKSL